MRKLLALRASLTLALGLTVFSAGSASALGDETFGCRIAPGPSTPYQEYCYNWSPANEYNVGFAVENVTGPATYSWSVPAQYTSMIWLGCTSSDYDCAIMVPNGSHYIPVTVTITQGGVSRSLTAYGNLSWSCGDYFC
jgi:hypothetical protein